MNVKQYPFYIKSTVVLLGICLLIFCLSILGGILIPLSFSIIVSILLNPLCNWLMAHKIPKIPAILITLLIAMIVIGGIVFYLTMQVISFQDSLPLLKAKFHHLFLLTQENLFSIFGISFQKQSEMLKDAANSSKALVGSTIETLFSSLSVIFLMPVYIFLFLLYKTLVLNFIYEVFAEENAHHVQAILGQTKKAIQSYMVGLLIEALIVAILNSVALLILGVKYAVLFGILGALLNVIPYIGGIIAIALPVVMATITKDGYSTQLGIILAYSVIQFVDNNILIPRIVSSKVRINALITIVMVLLGGAIWGVSGMFLSLPFIAILKIIFDRVDGLQPWGRLLGDEIPTVQKRFWNRKKLQPDQNI